MVNVWFVLAALAAAATCAVHVVLGGREAMRPLLAASDIDRTAKFVNYYCWHLATITLAAMTLAYAFAARPDAPIDLAVLATAMAFAFAGWSLAMIARHRLSAKVFSQWAFFVAIGALGLIGLLA